MKNLYHILIFSQLIFICHFNSYAQIKSPNKDLFSYFKFLPHYYKFINDTNDAIIFKRNKVKSVSYFVQDYRYGKYDKGIIYEKREYNRDGFLVKITNPGIRIYRGQFSIGSEDGRIDSTTYKYLKENSSITYNCWVRKYPETTNYKFDSLGRLFYIEDIQDSAIFSNEIINYDLENNRIFTIDTNQYHKISGKIFIISNNRISKILDYDDKDTVILETYQYGDNKLTVKEFANDYEDRTITRYYNDNGKLVKEIREIEDKDIIVEEYFYGKDFIKSISYKREIESSFSIFNKVSKSIIYLNSSNLPILEMKNWWGIFYYRTQFQYEYYE